METFITQAEILDYNCHRLSPPVKPHGLVDANKGLVSLKHGRITVTLHGCSSWNSHRVLLHVKRQLCSSGL